MSLSPSLLTFECAKGKRFARPTRGAAWQSWNGTMMCNVECAMHSPMIACDCLTFFDI